MDALRNNAIVNETDIENLTSSRSMLQGQIEILGKFQDICSGVFKESISQLSKKIEVLEHEVAVNHKIADLVFIEIKALFAKSLAKIQGVSD